jgi:hypothetical protein
LSPFSGVVAVLFGISLFKNLHKTFSGPAPAPAMGMPGAPPGRFQPEGASDS